jgi:hypothetical protein
MLKLIILPILAMLVPLAIREINAIIEERRSRRK